MTVRLFQPRRLEDDRGWFAETYSARAFARHGIDTVFVQDNQSLSRTPFTLRGIHFQAPPHAQDKLIRCLRGRIFDVAVDLRRGSPTYGKWVGATLGADDGAQLLVPVGFGHAFLTLEPDTEVAYKTSDFYAAESEGALAWDDPAIAVDWPLPAGREPALSPKDAHLAGLTDFDTPFVYDDATPLAALGEGHAGNV